jgi:hypothetical protein
LAHGRRSEKAGDPVVESRWQDLLAEHIAKTDYARGENAWKYKQRLVAYFPFPYFWAHEPEMLRLSIDGRSHLVSLEEVLRFPVLTTVVHPESPFYYYIREKPERSPFVTAWGPSDVGLSDDDLYSVSGEHTKAIFSQRHVGGVRWLSSGHLAIDWHQGDCEPPLLDEPGIGAVAFENPDVICFRLHQANTSDQFIVLNTKNEIARWILRINDSCRQRMPMIGIDQVKLLNDLLKWSAWFQTASEKFTALREFVPRWRDIPGLPTELCPPPIQITPRMFELSRKPLA